MPSTHTSMGEVGACWRIFRFFVYFRSF